MKYFELDKNRVVAYYEDKIHGDNIPNGAKKLTEELYSSLLNLSLPILLKNLPEEEIYGIEYVKYFSEEKHEQISNDKNTENDIDEKLNKLEEENLELKEIIAIMSEENDNKISNLQVENLELKETIAVMAEKNDDEILSLQMAIAEIVEGGI